MGCTPICDCNLSMSNTGTDCTPLFEVTKRINFIPIYDSTGVRNFIDLTTTINQALFTALINQTDVSKRLFPTPEILDIDDTRGEPITEKFKNDSTVYIREGIRNFKGFIVAKNASVQLKGALESARCGEVGVYLVDRLGNYIGIVSDDKTKLYPIRIDSDSLAATLVKKTDTTTQKIQLMFNFHPDEDDNCLGMISNTEMGDAKPLLFRGLINVYATYTGPSTTGVVVKLWTPFGTPVNPTTVKGLIASDFVSSNTATASKVYNQSDAADLAVTVTEGVGALAGTYALVWPAETTGDIIVIKPKKNGFDFIAVEQAPVTIP